MTAELIDALIKQSPLVAALSIGAWILWKRYDKYTERTQKKLDDLETRMNEYLTTDRKRTDSVIEHSARAMDEFTKTNKRTNAILECLIPQLNDFKKSPIYSEYLKQQK